MNHIPVRNVNSHAVTGNYVDIGGESWYKISNSQLMPEFFMSPVSSGDHWMFVSSQGALSAGRKNPDSAIFPYYSSDKLVDTAAFSGPKTIIRAHTSGGSCVNWEPFSDHLDRGSLISRNLYKNFLGNQILFEEINESLNLAWRYGWSFGHRFGFVRTCRLTTLGGSPIRVSVLDGIQNVLPYGLDQNFQLRFSNLGDAYKKSELLSDSQMGLFYLSSIPTDRAEPSEGLRATVAWQCGLSRPTVLLSTQQLKRFRAGLPVNEETEVRGRRGAYFVAAEFDLGGEDPIAADWRIMANVNQDHTDVINLHRLILDSPNIQADVSNDVAKNHRRLLSVVSSSDGRQLGADSLRVQRHQSNVLFNVMRGGVPLHGYGVNAIDFRRHVRNFNSCVYDRNQAFLEGLDESTGRTLVQDQSQTSSTGLRHLLHQVAQTDDSDLYRIALEYLPFTFSRRHGDPTRPWNAFSIDFLDADGSENLCYEGNWRDIFQNWEALALAYPDFISSMIFRFVNASTADGYNPYRVSKDGFDWETLDPDDPWANIGYWGDHQIIYLLKLLEWSKRFAPSRLDQWLGDARCAYAQVPYRIRNYDGIRCNPKETIDFDHELAGAIEKRVAAVGADGKLLPNSDGNPYHVTLTEKLLVPALVKITNFVPGGGVWLNTQRPEWNDANNALVGNGLSMVTACYLRRFMAFMLDWFSDSDLPDSVSVSREVVELLQRVSQILRDHADAFEGVVSDQERKQIVDCLSIAGSEYRENLYKDGLSGDKHDLQLSDCILFFERCLVMLDHTIRSNRRSDGLYHSYNLILLGDESYGLEPLQEMLEGQVAVLSSGLLSAEEAADVLDALRASELYREDQQSYMLYPDRDLDCFLEKNSLSEGSWSRSNLLQRLLADDETSIVRRDSEGGVHFNGDFRNVADLNRALDALDGKQAYAQLARDERKLLGELFEQTFNHKRFTGRSGTFFAYEGLGSIYWHMVSKLALATIENYIWAKEAFCQKETGRTLVQDQHETGRTLVQDQHETGRTLVQDQNQAGVLERLHEHYRNIRSGIGLTKSPQQYGAIPSDPYSHTPKGAGVQQPGMTGQVKEDILSRMAELGVRVHAGALSFDPCLFESSELLDADSQFEFYDLDNRCVELPLSKGSFAYTICQVPIIYQQATGPKLILNYKTQEPVHRERLTLTESETRSIFLRRGEITSIEVHVDLESCS